MDRFTRWLRLKLAGPAWTIADMMPPEIPGDPINTVYALEEDSYIHQTRNFSDRDVDWKVILKAKPGQKLLSMTLDHGHPQARCIVWASDGIYWSGNLDDEKPVFELIKHYR